MSGSGTQESEEPTEPNVEQSDPAKRLHAIIEVALGQNPGITALDAWASTLGINISAAQADPHDVIDRLRLMKEEIVVLRRAMQKTQFSADLYEPSLQNVSRLLPVANLAAAWNAFVGAVSPQDMLALRWCSQAIEGESALTHAELQSLLDAINAFKERVELEDLPESVREFVLNQIELMVKGIHQYPIVGRRAAREAIRRAVADSMDVDDDVSTAAPTRCREKLAKLWNTLLASVEGTQKMVTAVTGLAETVPKLTNAVSTATNLLP